MDTIHAIAASKHLGDTVQDFISEDDLKTLDGWLKYQAVDQANTPPEELEDWQRAFEEARERIAACPKVGLMKLQPVPGEHKYAVAIEDGSNLWLTLWVRRSRKGEFFVMLPRGDRDWNPHWSYHLDGTLHIKSYGVTALERKNQPLTGTFQGSEDLGSHAGHGPKGVGAICDPAAFSGVVRVAPGVLGPRHGEVKLDLVEPGHEPMKFPGKVIVEQTFQDTVPWLVVRVGNCADIAPLGTVHGHGASQHAEGNQVKTGLKGCGERADTQDVKHFPGQEPKVVGDSNPSQYVCGDRRRGQTGSFPIFFSHPQKPFAHPNSRSTLIFDHLM